MTMAAPPVVGLRLGAVCLAAALYGAVGQPAPQDLRSVEAAIALLLAGAVGLARPCAIAAGLTLGGERWEAVGTAALACLVWVPLLRGLTLGSDAADIVRDVAPLLFLFLPLALVPALRRARSRSRAVGALAAALALAGVLFALRWWRQADWGFGAVGVRAMDDGLRYFLNAPSVLFAAIGLPVAALRLAAGGRAGAGRWATAALLTAGGILCLGALAGAVHRMALGLAVPAMLGVALWQGRRTPAAAVIAAAAAFVAVAVLGDTVLGALEQVADKSRMVGSNARVDEALAALEQVGQTWTSLLIGDGWGALLSNPAVGGWRVSYTHTLATYALLKGGVLGLVALAAWLVVLTPRAAALLRRDLPLAAALLPALLVPLALHASYKYLDTGLLLTLLVLATEPDGGADRATGTHRNPADADGRRDD